MLAIRIINQHFFVLLYLQSIASYIGCSTFEDDQSENDVPNSRLKENDCSPNPCQNDGTCIDETDGYTCICTAGWEGKNCEMNHDDCNPDPCKNGGTCIDGSNDYICKCIAGWEGKDCEKNHDNCSPNPCKNGGTCKDEVDDYICNCLPEWIGKNCDIEPSSDASPRTVQSSTILSTKSMSESTTESNSATQIFMKKEVLIPASGFLMLVSSKLAEMLHQ